MREPRRARSPFETAHENLRSVLRYLRYELAMPADTIKLQVGGILHSFTVEEMYERENAQNPMPERPK